MTDVMQLEKCAVYLISVGKKTGGGRQSANPSFCDKTFYYRILLLVFINE